MRDSIIDSSALWDFRFIHETSRKIQYKTDQLIFSFRANRDSWRVHRIGKNSKSIPTDVYIPVQFKNVLKSNKKSLNI